MISEAESTGRRSAPGRPRIIALLNQKGGVGKTTSTVNLGAAIAESGRRVCLIDLDPQAHLTLHLGIEPERVTRSVYDLLIDPECTAEQAIIAGARPNLDALLAEVDLAAAETELASTPDRQQILRDKFQSVAARYDVVLIDCPPSLGLLTLNALTLAEELFVPMQAHFLALQGVGRLLETVGLVSASVNPELRVSGIILCMHEKQTTLAREIVADLDEFFDAARTDDVPWRQCRVLRPPIRRNIKLAEAPSFGQTIFDYAPWCPGALDYRKLADNVLSQWDDVAEPEAVACPSPADEPADHPAAEPLAEDPLADDPLAEDPAPVAAASPVPAPPTEERPDDTTVSHAPAEVEEAPIPEIVIEPRVRLSPPTTLPSSGVTLTDSVRDQPCESRHVR